jgi:hypothetical protein
MANDANSRKVSFWLSKIESGVLESLVPVKSEEDMSLIVKELLSAVLKDCIRGDTMGKRTTAVLAAIRQDRLRELRHEIEINKPVEINIVVPLRGANSRLQEKGFLRNWDKFHWPNNHNDKV